MNYSKMFYFFIVFTLFTNCKKEKNTTSLTEEISNMDLIIVDLNEENLNDSLNKITIYNTKNKYSNIHNFNVEAGNSLCNISKITIDNSKNNLLYCLNYELQNKVVFKKYNINNHQNSSVELVFPNPSNNYIYVVKEITDIPNTNKFIAMVKRQSNNQNENYYDFYTFNNDGTDLYCISNNWQDTINKNNILSSFYLNDDFIYYSNITKNHFYRSKISNFNKSIIFNNNTVYKIEFRSNNVYYMKYDGKIYKNLYNFTNEKPVYYGISISSSVLNINNFNLSLNEKLILRPVFDFTKSEIYFNGYNLLNEKTLNKFSIKTKNSILIEIFKEYI